MNMMIAKGHPVTVINVKHDECTDVYSYYEKHAMLPMRKPRFCTKYFKIIPLEKYYSRPCVELIGFDSSEDSRRQGMIEKDGVVQEYPLITAGIDRGGCEEIIKRHGLSVPMRSGCYICPFQGRKEWIELREKHPDLFCRAKRIEELCNERRAAAGKSLVYFRDRPLEDLVHPKDGYGHLKKPGQMSFLDDRPPCRCGL